MGCATFRMWWPFFPTPFIFAFSIPDSILSFPSESQKNLTGSWIWIYSILDSLRKMAINRETNTIDVAMSMARGLYSVDISKRFRNSMFRELARANREWSCRYVVAAIGILLERFQWSRVFSSLGDRILRPVYNCLCLMELAIAYLIESLLLLFHSFNHKVLLYSKLQSRMKVKQVRLKQCSSK